MRIVTVLGARPQFVKAGSVSREIEKRKVSGTDIDEIIVHTGQHYDANMSDVFFDEMRIPRPAHFLGIANKSHGAMTGAMMTEIERVLLAEKPDMTLVYGDTNSTMAGALASVKLHIPVAHVEAGLRSGNMAMPEEINRIVTDRVSRLLFCPTEVAMRNLALEGEDHWQSESLLVGDVMQDGALFYGDLAKPPQGLEGETNFVLSTVHRAENTDDPARLVEIFSALKTLAEKEKVILPLHPRTRNIVQEAGLDLGRIEIIEPVGYLNMVWLIARSRAVLTDSGGLQKEAFFFAKPCVTMRDETEWVELVEHGYNRLAGANAAGILEAFDEAVASSPNFDLELYGGGRASERIVSRLTSHA